MKGGLQPSTGRFRADPLSFLVEVAASATNAGGHPPRLRSELNNRRLQMATRESAEKKFVSSTESPLAVDKMSTKLATYLGGSKSAIEGSTPVKNWKAGDKEMWFDKCYDNMKIAYGV
jgi:hypothetical protein